MALVDVDTIMWPPPLLNPSGGAPGFTSVVLDAVNEKVQWIFRAPKSGTINKIGFRVGTVTTGTTGEVRLETVDATTGNATGTLVSAGANNASCVISTGLIWYEFTLTTGAVVTATDLLAAVFSCGTPGNLGISNWASTSNFPYVVHEAPVSTFTKLAVHPNVGIGYNDGTWGKIPPGLLAETLSSRTYHSGSSPDEVALRFQLPFSARVVGAWCLLDCDGNLEFVLYDGTTVITTATLDVDVRGSTGVSMWYAFFDVAAILPINTTFRLAVKPTSVTSIGLPYLDTDTAGHMDGLPGGTSIYQSTRQDLGAWTDQTNSRPFMGLMIDQLDDGSGLVLGGAGPSLWTPGGVSSIRY